MATAKKTKAAVETVETPAVQELRVYPAPGDMTDADMKEMKAEYTALKELGDEATPEQAERRAMLLAHGKEANKIIATKGQKKAAEVAKPASKAEAKPAAPAFDPAVLVGRINAVIPLDVPLPPDADKEQIIEALSELAVKDFSKAPDEEREIFTLDDIKMILALGVQLPGGVEVPTDKPSKPAKTEKIQKGGHLVTKTGVKAKGVAFPIYARIYQMAQKETHTRAEIIEAIKMEFPGKSPSTYPTMVTDQFNPKYAKVPTVLVKLTGGLVGVSA